MAEWVHEVWGEVIGIMWRLRDGVWEGQCRLTGRTLRSPTAIKLIMSMRDEARTHDTHFRKYVANKEWLEQGR